MRGAGVPGKDGAASSVYLGTKYANFQLSGSGQTSGPTVMAYIGLAWHAGFSKLNHADISDYARHYLGTG